MTDKPLVHEQTIAEYLGQASVVGMPSDHGAASFEHVRKRYAEFSEWERIETPDRPDLDLRRKGKYANVALDADTGELLGGYTTRGPYTVPAHRGRGICSEIHYHLDLAGLRADAAAYTMSGMMTRAATHRLHVERALRRGLNVPDRVLADYRIDAGGEVRLREPMTAERHGANAKALRRLEAERIISEEAVGYTAVFRCPEDLGDADFVSYSAGYDGFALAIGLMREFGAEIRATLVEGRAYTQAIINDDLIDSHGIRPVDLCLEDLWRRGEFRRISGLFPVNPPSAPKASEVRIFASEAELLDWLRPGDPFGHARGSVGFSELLVEEAMASRPGRAACQALEDILEQKYISMTA
ncbi:hypothetical protein [Paracoccus sp. ME4]|uniref:hypothetical protein n=1 Tax=Paracoccus sp. ME4 TaxID=3138066 RepID=UPI00398B6347